MALRPTVPLGGDGGDGLPPFGTDRPVHLGRTIAELPLLGLLAVVIALLVKTVLAQAFFIPSESMEPQLQKNDRVLVSRLSYRLHEPRRGDVLVFDSPEVTKPPDHSPVPIRLFREALEAIGVRAGQEELIKRVIGLPGETVEARNNHILINGRELVEPYLPPGTVTLDFGPVTVGENQYWMMGDNRTNSSDSRVFGPVEADTMVGRAIMRVWPPHRVAFL
jgi:signal peptidase I